MEVVHRTARVPYSTQQMYALVNDIEAYPEFLPWCVAAHVESRTDEEIIAGLTLEKGGVRKRFTTRNVLDHGSKLEMHLVEGPFKHLYGVWTFVDISDGFEV